MAIRISYTARDFGSILSETRDQILRELPDSNDFLESNIGRFFMDYVAATTDMLGFYIDRFAAESFIDRVETRGGLISLLKLIGFQPQNPQPERVEVTFTLDSIKNTDVSIPRYSRLRTEQGIDFVTAVSAVIPTGSPSVVVGCIQGVWRTAKFTSNGGPNQRFLISSFRTADGMFRLFVDSQEWFLATNNTFVGHADNDTVFRYVYTEDRRVIIELGDGLEGHTPAKGAEIDIRYMDTLHTEGKALSGEVTFLLDQVLGVNLSVDNAEPSSGGSDFEDIESARLRYPAAFKPLRRAVTLEDWESLAKLVPGVMQTKAVDVNIDPALAHFFIKLYVIGNGGVVSEALNTAVREALLPQRVNATIFEMISPTPVPVGVDINLFVLRAYTSANVQAAVIAAIEDFFTMTATDESEVNLGESVRLSRLTARIQSVDGVSSFTYVSPTSDVSISHDEFARLGTVKVTVKGVV